MRRSTRLATPSTLQQVSKTIGKASKPVLSEDKAVPRKASKAESSKANEPLDDQDKVQEQKLAAKKWQSWSAHAASSPFPDFQRPTPSECQQAYRVLDSMHHDAVEEEFNDPNTPETIPNVLDAMMVAILSSATSWNNAKRAMNSMKQVYGSVFAYDDIVAGGREKLEATIRCGGLHIRKSTIITSMLKQVDEDAMKELISYKGIGPKCAFVVMTWSLKRNNFTVDTHVFRIAGLWGWVPEKASREQAQAHLDATVPKEIKFHLHFLLIQHGRTCPACRGGSKGGVRCEAREQLKVK
ncbi:hypothetical protein LTR56_001329 [Elasticomyces elasticus]|nr:hypothetical protein LTR56_001329 [Elasticomyces elasticus]KAK3667510.1 hypothetical protein LTR22_001688 [Elasticomyces elasticus]KAK4928010.1 hypothetical protein LTR49_005209 [Elasticomyces elasticus]KAK5762449.1 hypothetical protein LTS12_007426 [Elasticomyces elasticus]